MVVIIVLTDLVVEVVEKRKPMAVVNFIMYRTLGELLPLNLAGDVRLVPWAATGQRCAVRVLASHTFPSGTSQVSVLRQRLLLCVRVTIALH